MDDLKKASWKLTKTINENMWLGVDLLAQDRHLCLQLLHAVALARRRRCLPAPRAPRRGRAALAVARAFPAAAAHGARAAGCVSGSGAGGEARPRLWRGRRRTRASARGGFESKRRGPPRDGSGPPRDGSRRGARGAGAASRAPRKEPPALPSKARGGVGCYARYRADATADTRLRSGGARTRRGGVCARRRVEAGAGAVGTSTICAPKEAQIVEGGRQRGFVSERIFLRSWGWGRAPRQAESARRRAIALLRPGPSPSARAAAPPWRAAASAAHGSNTCARRTKQRAASTPGARPSLPPPPHGAARAARRGGARAPPRARRRPEAPRERATAPLPASPRPVRAARSAPRRAAARCAPRARRARRRRRALGARAQAGRTSAERYSPAGAKAKAARSPAASTSSAPSPRPASPPRALPPPPPPPPPQASASGTTASPART